jgi:hypothetical protein
MPYGITLKLREIAPSVGERIVVKHDTSMVPRARRRNIERALRVLGKNHLLDAQGRILSKESDHLPSKNERRALAYLESIK